MVIKAYKTMMAAILILSKTERYYKKWIGNNVVCDRNAKYWKENEK